jgi:hypothetical protein
MTDDEDYLFQMCLRADFAASAFQFALIQIARGDADPVAIAERILGSEVAKDRREWNRTRFDQITGQVSEMQVGNTEAQREEGRRVVERWGGRRSAA